MLLSLSVSKMMTSATTCLSWCHIVSLALPICFIVPNETDWQHGWLMQGVESEENAGDVRNIPAGPSSQEPAEACPDR
jgi:hypothetical protein